MMRLFKTVLVADEPWSTYSANVLSQLAIRESSKESARQLGSQSDYESSASTRHRLFRNMKDLLRWVRIALRRQGQARRWRAHSERAMSEPVAATGPARTRARIQTWGLIGIALALYGVLRFVFGPLPQDPSYHILADTRLCGFIPRAGDVLTNLSILTAGIAGVFLWRRVHVAPEERAAYALLVAGMLLTARSLGWCCESRPRLPANGLNRANAHQAIPGSAADRLLQRHGHRLLSQPETKLQT